MSFNTKSVKNEKATENTDPLFMLTDLLIKIDRRAKIVPIPKEAENGENN